MKYQTQNNYSAPLLFLQDEVAVNHQAISEKEFGILKLQELPGHLFIGNDVPVKLRNFAIIWIKEGIVKINIDLHEYVLQDNELICLLPGQLCCIYQEQNPQGYYISFSPEFLLMAEGQANGSFMDLLYERKKLAVVQPGHEMEAVLNMMNNEYGSYGLMRLQILQGLLKILLAYVSNSVDIVEQANGFDRDAEMVRKFMKLVKQYFLSRKMVADYASELCVSPNYLNRIVKKISGFTASYHIQQQIVLEAKRQAIYSSMSMKEVAYSLGFNDYAHFSKFFKNNSGMNFTCFKNGINRRA
jgi:AraC family transcriptional regulator, transcriptional activator of pobA